MIYLIGVQNKPQKYPQARPQEADGRAFKDETPEYFPVIHSQSAHHPDLFHTFEYAHQHRVGNAHSGNDKNHQYKNAITCRLGPG